MVVPRDFQKFRLQIFFLLTQHKHVTSKLNKKHFGTVIIKAYGENLKPNSFIELSPIKFVFVAN